MEQRGRCGRKEHGSEQDGWEAQRHDRQTFGRGSSTRRTSCGRSRIAPETPLVHPSVGQSIANVTRMTPVTSFSRSEVSYMP